MKMRIPHACRFQIVESRTSFVDSTSSAVSKRKYATHTLEKVLRAFMLPKRRVWNAEQKRKSGFSMDFSMVRSPNRVLTPLKNQLKILMSSFVPPSQIFVWGA
jgi:hypothetical protein